MPSGELFPTGSITVVKQHYRAQEKDPCYKGDTLALAKDQDFRLVSTPSQLSLLLTVLGESKDE